MATEIKPVGPDEAERIAARMVGEYLNACRMTDRAQIGNYLMKLCSVVSVAMAQAEGSVTAYERLEGVAHFILNNCPALPTTLLCTCKVCQSQKNEPHPPGPLYFPHIDGDKDGAAPCDQTN